MIYYLASPYSVNADYELMRLRYLCALKKSTELTKEGHVVFSPIVHSHPMSTHYSMPTTFDFWEKIDYDFIRASAEVWVYKMEGWEDSIGVQKEIAFATSIGKPVRYLECEKSPPKQAYKPRVKNSVKTLYGKGISDSWYSPQQVRRVGLKANGKCEYEISWACPVYHRWANMVKRCYSQKSFKIQPTYEECVMSEDWLVFSKFKAWHDSNFVPEWHLDKDILLSNNKTYSSDSCVFVPVYLNQIMAVNTNGIYLPGVNKRYTKHRVKVYNTGHEFNGVRVSKDFYTEVEAHGWWCQQRAKAIRQKLEKYNRDPRGKHKELVTKTLEDFCDKLVEYKSWEKAKSN